ncbi:MAG: hypothetical protein JWL76_1549 [Thermoleophilia bacterium]|nr:hypothetical protein [Thermoleophilia bacterium]
METALASLGCGCAIAWCVERLVNGRDARWVLLPLTFALTTWVWLWTLRMPPTPGSALLAFAIADLGVLAIGVVAVLRLLGGFDARLRDDPPEGEDDGDGDDDLTPVAPWDPPPSTARPLARHHVPPRNRRRQDHRRRRPTKV